MLLPIDVLSDCSERLKLKIQTKKAHVKVGFFHIRKLFFD